MTNRHHVLFPRTIHESTHIGNELRSKSILIPRMDEDIHAELHDEISFVPMLNHYMGSRILKLMNQTRAHSPINGMKNYMLAVENSMEHSKVNELDRQLGRVVIESVGAQIPFVEKSNKIIGRTYIDLGENNGTK